MKLKTPEIEFVKFDTEDIITTSGSGLPEETTIPIIYLSRQSVTNYNDMFEKDTNLAVNTDWEYYGYEGTVLTTTEIIEIPGFGPYEYTSSKYTYVKPCNTLTEEQKKALHIVNDINGYNEVLAWLNSHGSAQ